jgi:hypothetical protein
VNVKSEGRVYPFTFVNFQNVIKYHLQTLHYKTGTDKQNKNQANTSRDSETEKHKKVQNYSENGQIKTDGEDERSTRGINHTKRKSETTNRQPER